jgi:uncharacterized protein (DUF342 family)
MQSAILDSYLKELYIFENERSIEWLDQLTEERRAHTKEKSKYEDQIYWLEKDKFKSRWLLNEAKDEVKQVNETNLNLRREISFKDDIIRKLREIIAATLYKHKKDADGIDEIFDKDFNEYDIVVTDALELDTE